MDKDGSAIQSVAEMAARFSVQLGAAIPAWEARLQEEPDDLETIEREVQALAARGADMVVAGLISVTLRDESVRKEREAVRKSFAYPLQGGRERSFRVRLLGGLVIWVCSLYCQPRRRLLRKADQETPGVYLGAAQLGIADGASPGLLSRVARQAALLPSFEFARDELARSGVEINVKTVRRLAQQCGEMHLRQRKLWVEQWRAGTLPAGAELAGQRVAVQVDGGRTKLRGELQPARRRPEALNEEGLVVEDAPGRSKKASKKTYDADWREPKLLTIFVHDENGKMKKEFAATIDGTFQGPDAAAELVAMHLHRLGAAQAESLTFCGDGAPWIWDRIDTIVEQAGLEQVARREVLDNCHAAHHISLALAALGLNEKKRMPLYREQRTRLRNGQWRRVVEELRGLAEGQDEDSQIHTEIAYLEKHGEAGRLNYRRFRQLGIPLGSGAIESTIRRVINQRLKGNAISWREQRAEAMLQLRALVISGRWDERTAVVRNLRRRDARRDWTWQPRPMSVKHEANLTTAV